MTEHETNVITYLNEKHAYCTCGWADTWLPDDEAAYKSTLAHKDRHKKGEVSMSDAEDARDAKRVAPHDVAK